MDADPRRERIDAERPTAEEMLERVRREETQASGRGHLRVFFGAAPGVGKTYAMLEEGHRLRAAGKDVVIGFVETYGRAETEALIRDLEVIPRRRIPYHGVVLEEMDTDAILRRHPEIALVDELAHTNAPGSTRRKRYEDVEALLAAGINVLSTVNIQHLESVNDLVESFSGVKVRETIPDKVFDQADIELVDLPPSLLRERLAAGKIYPRPQAERALENFFRESNLTALRELALRRTAEEVEATLESYMRGEQVPQPWPTIERVMVSIDDRPEAEALLRRGWRLARGIHADLLAVAVIDRPVDQLPEERRKALLNHLELAEDLGATAITVIDQDVVSGLTRVAQSRNVTDVVIGQLPSSRWKSFSGGSAFDRLVRRLPGVDIHVVSRCWLGDPP